MKAASTRGNGTGGARHFVRAALALAVCGWLAACQQPLPQAPSGDYVAETVEFAHTMRFARGSVALDAAESNRLRAFLAQVRPGSGAAARLDVGGQLAEPRRAALLDQIRRNADVRMEPGGTAAPEDGATLALHVTIILPKACLSDGGRMDDRLLPPGCANALNLLYSVEDSADLFRGRAMGPAAAAPVARAAERYLDPGASAGTRGVGPAGPAAQPDVGTHLAPTRTQEPAGPPPRANQ